LYIYTIPKKNVIALGIDPNTLWLKKRVTIKIMKNNKSLLLSVLFLFLFKIIITEKTIKRALKVKKAL
jgi:hypothetical protein